MSGVRDLDEEFHKVQGQSDTRSEHLPSKHSFEMSHVLTILQGWPTSMSMKPHMQFADVAPNFGCFCNVGAVYFLGRKRNPWSLVLLGKSIVAGLKKL